MTQKDTLREIERKAYLSTFQDGFWDISWAIWLLCWAIVPLLEYLQISRYWGYPLLFFPALIIVAGKKYLTIPRLGTVRFGSDRLARGLKLFVAIIIMMAIIWLVFFLSARLDFPRGWQQVAGGFGPDLLMGFLIMILLSIVAYFMDYSRMYIYAILVGLGIPLVHLLEKYLGEPLNHLIVFGIPGLAVLLFGLILFFRFLNKYPRSNPEVSDDA